MYHEDEFIAALIAEKFTRPIAVIETTGWWRIPALKARPSTGLRQSVAAALVRLAARLDTCAGDGAGATSGAARLTTVTH